MHAHTMAWISTAPTSSLTMSPRMLQHASWQNPNTYKTIAHACVFLPGSLSENGSTMLPAHRNTLQMQQPSAGSHPQQPYLPPARAMTYPPGGAQKSLPERSGAQHVFTKMPRSCHTRCCSRTCSTSSPHDLQAPHGTQLPTGQPDQHTALLQTAQLCVTCAATSHMGPKAPSGPHNASAPKPLPDGLGWLRTSRRRSALPRSSARSSGEYVGTNHRSRLRARTAATST